MNEIVEIIKEFDDLHCIMQIILIGKDKKVRNIVLEAEE